MKRMSVLCFGVLLLSGAFLVSCHARGPGMIKKQTKCCAACSPCTPCNPCEPCGPCACSPSAPSNPSSY